MRPYWFRRLLLPALTILALAGTGYGQPPSPFVPGPWWKDFQKPLGLTHDQSSRIEDVFQTALPHLRQKRVELETQETELSRLIKADADDAAILEQSDRVEAVRTVMNKNRTLMLVHMRAILSPEQRSKLNMLREQWDRDHPRPRRRANAPR